MNTSWSDMESLGRLKTNSMARTKSRLSFLLLVVTGVVVVTSLQERGPVSATTDINSGLDGPCPRTARETCAPMAAAQRAGGESVLSAASVCGDVGYLCTEVESTGSQHILRWPERTGRLRIRVPLPTGMSSTRALELQSAAVRGIQYWQRRPFELLIDARPMSSEPADITITWGEGLSGSQLGLTRFRLSQERGEFVFEVQGISLAVRSPGSRSYPLPPEQVLLTAAHEMGHALGLPHSDSERDVMYPTNTARSLSNRDFRTLDALYRLPVGVEIKKDL